jgi:hypothetical protein
MGLYNLDNIFEPEKGVSDGKAQKKNIVGG